MRYYLSLQQSLSQHLQFSQQGVSQQAGPQFSQPQSQAAQQLPLLQQVPLSQPTKAKPAKHIAKAQIIADKFFIEPSLWFV